MNETATFNTLVWVWIAVAIITFIILLYVTAPYGRHTSKKWGISIPNRFGWMLMELPALVIFLLFVITGRGEKSAAVWVITALFAAHYTNRSIIFPLRIRTKGKEMPGDCSIRYYVPISLANLLNGWHLRFCAGRCLPFHSSSGYSAIWCPGPMTTINGTRNNFQATLREEKPYSHIFCKCLIINFAV